MLRLKAVLTAWVALCPLIGFAQSQDAPDTSAVPAEGYAFPETSQSRYRLGTARVFTNDLIGDGHDRWRTGSITSSRVYGYGWNGAAPTRFGEMLELRIQGQMMSPEDLKNVDPQDRALAGALSIGLHSHSTYHGAEIALGADLVVIGPQTGLDDFQASLHDLIDAPRPSDSVRAFQIGDTIRPTVVAEVGKTYDLGSVTRLRPFAELRAGDETLGRIGADFTFGSVGQGELLVRDSVTGQRYRVVRNEEAAGLAFTLGGDVAYVSDSIYLPEGRGYQLTDSRSRLRAGVTWQSEGASIFYGLTYLGKEFEGQREEQFTGSVRMRLSF